MILLTIAIFMAADQPQPGDTWYEWYYAEFNVRLYKEVGLDKTSPKAFKGWQEQAKKCLDRKLHGRSKSGHADLIKSREAVEAIEDDWDDEEISRRVQRQLNKDIDRGATEWHKVKRPTETGHYNWESPCSSIG